MSTPVFERQAPDPRLVDAALAGSRQRVLWRDELADVPRFDTFEGRLEADLVVVGGGYLGLWTALLAVRRNPGTRVVLLEAQQIGWAASGRNGGFCDASLTHGADNGRRRWPHEYDLLERLGQENLDALVQDVAELGIDAELEKVGFLDVATEPHQLAWLEADGGAQLLDEAGVQALVHSPTYLGAVRHEGDGVLVNPAKLAAGLARAAAGLGVQVFEHSPVTAVRPLRDSAAVVVETAAGLVRAPRVALATNVFPSLLARTRLMTVPVYDYVIATAPLTSDQLSSIGWAGREGIADLANHFHYYRRTQDDRIVFGGYDAIFRRQVRVAHEDRPATFRTLASHLLTTFPQLEGIEITHRWAGAIDTCTQFCAFHGLAAGGRVAYSAGFTGLGVGATRFAAQVMLDRLAGEVTERTELEMVRRKPLPFPPEPFATIGVEATRWSLDQADHREGQRNLLLRALDAVGLGFDS
ncbi:NAD(P)/FAD-dependent oxidoreductase [Cellulomonas citrea]|uniref:NAD(P)/FAD-dependent oxidoreductase n=1 Tax=Cellulomonas citrea TaxID=1909423 RepID=UPI00135B9348|nr:FAD-binding oxidoreductase [Cellulomonas citrea]